MTTDTDNVKATATMRYIVARLRTVKVAESRHAGFTYEAWAQEAADEIERLSALHAELVEALREGMLLLAYYADCRNASTEAGAWTQKARAVLAKVKK